MSQSYTSAINYQDIDITDEYKPNVYVILTAASKLNTAQVPEGTCLIRGIGTTRPGRRPYKFWGFYNTLEEKDIVLPFIKRFAKIEQGGGIEYARTKRPLNLLQFTYNYVIEEIEDEDLVTKLFVSKYEDFKLFEVIAEEMVKMEIIDDTEREQIMNSLMRLFIDKDELHGEGINTDFMEQYQTQGAGNPDHDAIKLICFINYLSIEFTATPEDSKVIFDGWIRESFDTKEGTRVQEIALCRDGCVYDPCIEEVDDCIPYNNQSA